nr:MAG TPA: holin [Caudoviricetes sp.]
MQINEIISLCATIAVFIGTVVSFVIALGKSIKKYKTAKTIAEQEAAINDMTSAAQGFIADAEKLYEDYTKQLIGTGAPVTTSIKSGALKKDSVMAKLSQYALEKGYVFDSEYWSGVIDKFVELTKNVNAKKNAA